jgi:hypothetical protein
MVGSTMPQAGVAASQEARDDAHQAPIAALRDGCPASLTHAPSIQALLRKLADSGPFASGLKGQDRTRSASSETSGNCYR